MKKTIILLLVLSHLIINCQNIKDFVKNDAFEIKVFKTSPEALSYINTIANKEKLTVAIGPDCTQKDFEELCKLDWIQNLKIGSSYPNKTSVTDIKPIQNLKNLKQLSIFSTINPSISKPIDASTFSKLILLEKLTIDNNDLINCKKLSTLVNLEKLSLSSSGLSDISFLTNATKLNSLSLRGSNTFTNVSFMSNLKNLEKLEIENNKTITEQNLKGIETLANITEASFIGCSNIKSLDFLINNVKMEEVYADECGLVNINGLINMNELEKLSIVKTKVISLDPLKEKRKLTTLEIDGIKITDLSALYNCVSLEKLYISSNITQEQQKGLEAKLPNLEIAIREEQ